MPSSISRWRILNTSPLSITFLTESAIIVNLSELLTVQVHDQRFALYLQLDQLKQQVMVPHGLRCHIFELSDTVELNIYTHIADLLCRMVLGW